MTQPIISAKKTISQLEDSKEFKEWKDKNKDNYLCHIFFVLAKEKEQVQIGYYDEKKDLITSFDVGNKIEIKSPEKPFKPDDMKVSRVDMNDVKMDFKEAIAIVEDVQKTKYPAEMPIQIIAILQNIKGFGTVYNITHVTHSFKTLNVKVNAENGDIMDEHLVSIVQFDKNTGN